MIATLTSSTQINQFYDVVVVGGGVAGLILANKLARTKHVLLLEAGDVDFSTRSQRFYAGDVVGDGTRYAPLDVGRVRALGGTSNIWGGDIADLEAFDFERRDYMPQSGWPINAETLSKYHSEALNILGVEGISEAPISGSKGNLIRFSRGVSKHRHVKDTFYDSMGKNPNVDLFINANLVQINLNKNADQVKSLSVRSYDLDKLFPSRLFAPAIEVKEGRSMSLPWERWKILESCCIQMSN